MRGVAPAAQSAPNRTAGRGLPLAFALTGVERHDLTATPVLLDMVTLACRLVVGFVELAALRIWTTYVHAAWGAPARASRSQAKRVRRCAAWVAGLMLVKASLCAFNPAERL